MMKRLLLLILLVGGFLRGFAQKSDTSGVIRCFANFPEKNATWIIDDQIMDQASAEMRLQKVDPAQILEISILKDTLTSSASGTSTRIVTVVTKGYAHAQVERLLNRLAKGYKQYRVTYPDDNDLVYVIDGKMVDGKPDEVLRKIYDTPLGRINYAGILDKYKFSTMIYRSVIVLTTKHDKIK